MTVPKMACMILSPGVNNLKKSNLIKLIKWYWNIKYSPTHYDIKQLGKTVIILLFIDNYMTG